MQAIRLGGWLALSLFIAMLGSGCASQRTQDAHVPYCSNTLDSPIQNFCEVTPHVLWRGAKPGPADAAWLIEHGVRTVVNLEMLHDDQPAFAQAELSSTDNYVVDYYRVRDWEPNAVVAPSILDEHVAHFLAIVSQEPKPIYVHCRAGKNRTGVMVAAYRVIIEGASIDAAIEEMGRYQGQWFDADAAYIRSLSTERREGIRKAALEWTSKLKRQSRISCQNGKCRSADL